MICLQIIKKSKLDRNYKSSENDELIDSLKMLSTKDSMLITNENFKYSSPIHLFKSLAQKVKEEDLGYEIDIKDDSRKKEEAEIN